MRIQKPTRVTREYTQRLSGAVEQVFPLLCPVREAQWIEGWDPEVVFTDSGIAEEDCVFITRDERGTATWTVTTYAPPHRMDFVKVDPAVVSRRTG